MILHPDGRLEGMPEEIARYKALTERQDPPRVVVVRKIVTEEQIRRQMELTARRMRAMNPW